MRLPAKIAVGLAILLTLAVVLLYVRVRSRQQSAVSNQPSAVTAPELPPPSPTAAPVIDTNGAEDKSDKIRVTNIKTGDIVSSPLVIEGEARGLWYFEATFPVVLEDGNGKILAQHYAQAEGEWMTEDFVPFKSTLTFTAPTSPTGTLILKKDNPSGMPELDEEIRILVRFKP